MQSDLDSIICRVLIIVDEASNVPEVHKNKSVHCIDVYRLLIRCISIFIKLYARNMLLVIKFFRFFISDISYMMMKQ